jgi:predicted nucleic acid-binding protein
MNAVDTNILIYVHDPRDPGKQQIASELVEHLSDGILVWQTVCEFLSASRKLAPFGYDFDQASDDIRVLMTQWTTALPSWPVLDRATTLLKRYSLAYWDAMLIAACLEVGVETLYTEDFGGYAEIDGLKIVNPFAQAAQSGK